MTTLRIQIMHFSLLFCEHPELICGFYFIMAYIRLPLLINVYLLIIKR